MAFPRNDDGERWCPDCRAVDPILEEAKERAPASVHFINVEITREEWKIDPGQGHFFAQSAVQCRWNPYDVALGCASR